MTVENEPSPAPKGQNEVLARLRPLFGRARRSAGPEAAAGALTVAVMLGALLLAFAQFQDLFRIVSPDGVVLDAPRAVRDGIDQHGWALVVLAAAAVGAAALALSSRQPLPAWAAAALAGIALVITLAFDLPDATSSGLTGGGKELGNAEPAVGLWLQLAASLLMLAAATGLALLLRERRPPPRRRPQRRPNYQR